MVMALNEYLGKVPSPQSAQLVLRWVIADIPKRSIYTGPLGNSGWILNILSLLIQFLLPVPRYLDYSEL